MRYHELKRRQLHRELLISNQEDIVDGQIPNMLEVHDTRKDFINSGWRQGAEVDVYEALLFRLDDLDCHSVVSLDNSLCQSMRLSLAIAEDCGYKMASPDLVRFVAHFDSHDLNTVYVDRRRRLQLGLDAKGK